MKRLKSYLLRIKAAACQGRGRFEKAVALLSEADLLTPNDPFLLLCLADALHRLGRRDDVLRRVQLGLALDKEGRALNRLMVDILMDSGAPLEQAIPYLKAVLRNRTGGDAFPSWMRQPKRLKAMEEHHDKWIAWAEKTLLDYETGRQGSSGS